MSKKTTHKTSVLNTLDNNTLGVLAACSDPTGTAFSRMRQKFGTS